MTLKHAKITMDRCVPSSTAEADLQLLLMIRHFELALLDLFARGEVSGTTHTCLGQEHIPVSLSPLLIDDDFVFSNHRGHGHYLSRYRDPLGLLAEITGRVGAICSGVGGSQHVLRHNYVSTGVQGESLPVAAGVAAHLRRTSAQAIAVAYIGDGTWGEGAVYEALNLAALWQLPLLVVVENNHIAQTTPTLAQMAGSIAGRAAAFGITHVGLSGVDLAAVRAGLEPIVRQVRQRLGPAVVEFDTQRIGPHSKGDDTRSQAAQEQARAADWYHLLRAADPELFDRIDLGQRDFIAGIVETVLASAESTWERS